MNKAIIHTNQSWLDVALQQAGGVEAVFDIAEANAITITDSATGTIVTPAIIDEEAAMQLQGLYTPASAIGEFSGLAENYVPPRLTMKMVDTAVDVKNNQNMLDIALQTTGSVESIFEIMQLNDVSDMGADVQDATMLKAPVKNKKTQQQLQGLHAPATAGNYTGGIKVEYEAEEFDNQEYYT